MQAVMEASPIHKLPFDTLNVIFLYSAPYPPKPIRLARPWFRTQQRGLEDIFFSITLAAVCNKWRFVAFSTPQLWTHFEFPESLWERKCVPCHILSLYFVNSKSLPIHLSLSFPAYGFRLSDGVLFHRSLDRALITSFNRTQSLSLCNPPLCWLEQLGRLAFILDLSIDWPDSASIPQNHLLIPHPHTLYHVSSDETSTKNIGRVIFQVPTTLTILELAEVQVDVCIKVMLGCPNLVEAYIHNPQKALDHNITYEELLETWFSQPVIFHHLTIFLWTEDPSIWKSALFDEMKTPQLHTLILLAHQYDLDVDSMDLLIQQFPDTLKTLQLESLDSVPITDLNRLLNANSPVEHLIMSKCALEVIENVFRALLTVEGTLGQVHLPRLNALTLRSCDNGWRKCRPETEEFDIKFDPLFESLERRLIQGDRFVLDLVGFDIDWNSLTQARLRKLAEKGVRLEILEDENRVEWL